MDNQSNLPLMYAPGQMEQNMYAPPLVEQPQMIIQHQNPYAQVPMVVQQVPQTQQIQVIVTHTHTQHRGGCRNCKQSYGTHSQHKMGFCAWMWCLVFSPTVVLGLIPCCTDCCNDKVFTCASCGHEVGRDRFLCCCSCCGMC